MHRHGLRLEQARDGEPNFTLTQVALNDTIMVFAFAPIVALLLGSAAITVPWKTLLLSVGLYIVVPLGSLRRARASCRERRMNSPTALQGLTPSSLLALLATLVLLFGSRASRSAPAAGHRAARRPDRDPGPLQRGARLRPESVRSSALRGRSVGLIGASNFFELAVAAAISCSASSPVPRWPRSSAC